MIGFSCPIATMAATWTRRLRFRVLAEWRLLIIDPAYETWSGGPADDQTSAVPPIELFARVEDSLADV